MIVIIVCIATAITFTIGMYALLSLYHDVYINNDSSHVFSGLCLITFWFSFMFIGIAEIIERTVRGVIS